MLVIIGFLGFLGGFFISYGIVNYKGELPLGDPLGIVVNDNAEIFVGLGFYGKIQVYNSQGKFIRNWSVNNSGGDFKMKLNDHQNIVILTARGDEMLEYTYIGEIVSRRSLTKSYDDYNISQDSFLAGDGKLYKINQGLFHKVIMIDKEETIMVDQHFILKIFKGPLPIGLLSLIGIIILLISVTNKVIVWDKK